MTSISPISSTQTTQPTDIRQLMEATRTTAMDAAAKALNLDPSALESDLQAGKSLKDVAASQGVDFSAVQSAITTAVKPGLDQAVSSGQLTSSQAANALTRLTSGDAPQRTHGHHHHGGGGGSASAVDTSTADAIDAAAQALKLDPTLLLSQLQSGKSLQDVATAQGVDFNKVQQAMSTATNGSAYSGSGTATSASGTGSLVNATA